MYEVALDARGFGPVAGVDEAGRGACAGPIVIAACILPRRTIPELSALTDSKALSPAARERLFPLILRFATATSTVIVPAGEIDAGFVNHYYLARLLEENPETPIELTWANQDGRGVHVNISGGGITRYADDVDLGQAFLEWLATDGQDTLVADNHEYPANPAVQPEPLIRERFGVEFVRDSLRADELGSYNADAVRLMDEADFG